MQFSLIFAAIAAAIAWTSPVQAQQVDPTQISAVDQVLRAAAASEDDLIGAELLIIKNGEVLHHAVHGYADREEQRALEKDAIWSIKSMTKPMVATAVLMLVEEGKVDLHEPVTNWMPDLIADRRMTVEHLLSHTSGQDGLGQVQFRLGFEGAMAAAALNEPEGPLGDYSYSDWNFFVLAGLITDRTGMEAGAFIKKRILDPLGMNDTYTWFSPDFDWAQRVPSRYQRRDGDEQSPIGKMTSIWTNKDEFVPFFPGAFGVWGTARDYAKFLQFFLDDGSVGGRNLLNPSLVRLALTSHTAQQDGSSYGLGWFVEGLSDDRGHPALFFHGGYDGTEGRAAPGANAIYVLMTHSRGARFFRNFRNVIRKIDGLGMSDQAILAADQLGFDPLSTTDHGDAWTGVYERIFSLNGEESPVKFQIVNRGDFLQFSVHRESVANAPTYDRALLLESPTSARTAFIENGGIGGVEPQPTLSIYDDILIVRDDDKLIAIGRKNTMN